MWQQNRRNRGIRGIFGSLFAKQTQRRARRGFPGGSESLEERLVLSDYAMGQILVGFGQVSDTELTPAEELSEMIPGGEARALGDYGVFLLKLPNGMSVPDGIASVLQQPGVKFAEPDWIGEWSKTPNDPDFGIMWGMENTGQTVNGLTGLPGADSSLSAAWDVTTGSKSVIVAVVDSGTDYLHPDLAANIFVNTGEIPGNGIDDDNNGYIDDVNGYDFADADNDPMDFVGHGTHVAGTIGAVGDNGIGTVGVNWNVSVLPLKIGADLGGPLSSAAIEAINYAVSIGAAVSNHSYGIAPSAALSAAADNAEAQGHIIVCSAGNASSNNDAFPSYPANLPNPNVVSVAATTQTDSLAGFSNFGRNTVDIGAPGENIWSTTPRAASLFYGPNYDFSDGTSMASPMVAGAIALLRSVAPSAPFQTIIDAIYNGADKIPALTNRVSSGGRLNVQGALQQLQLASFSVAPGSIAENAGANAATLTIRKQTAPINQPLTLEIVVSDLSEVTLPGITGNILQVTIPAFRRSVQVPITAVDDTLLDGTQIVQLELQSSGATIDLLNIAVTDHETLSVTAIPNIVTEADGPGAGILRVARSNTDTSSPDRVVTVDNELIFIDKTGVEVSRVAVPWPGGLRPVADEVRDITFLEDGRVAVFNGVNTVYVSLYSPTLDAWTHTQIPGATASVVDRGTGGIAASGTNVYLSDLETGTGDPFGLVQFDTTTGTITRFGTRMLGDRLFGSSWPQSDIYELDPSNGSVLRTYPTPANGSTSAGLAFDGTFIWYIVSNSDALYKIDAETGTVVDTFFVGTGGNSSYEGLAWMNGLVYLLDPFITDEIVVFDPNLRQVIDVLEVGALNNSPGAGGSLNLSGGLAPNPSRNSLFVSATFNDEIYEVSARTGILLTRAGNTPRVWNSGIRPEGMATVGNQLYISEFNGNSDIHIYDFDGNPQGQITDPFFFSMYGLGGDGVPGLVENIYRYRDVTVGLDGYIYAVSNNGEVLARFDSATLELLDMVPLPQSGSTVSAISVGEDGTIYAGLLNGDIIALDAAGNQIGASLQSVVGSITDIEVNINGDIVFSGINGDFGYADTSLDPAALLEVTNGTGSPAFMSFGEHIARDRGRLEVTLTNSDLSEISVPLTVVIPEGEQVVDIPFDAVDDNLRDGAQVVYITGSAPLYVPDTETITVLDSESIAVDVQDGLVSEALGANATTVRVSRTDTDGPFDYRSVQQYSNPQVYQLRDVSTNWSSITVPGQISRIADVNVTVNFQHDWIPDLDVYLISPAGTRVELFTDLVTNEHLMVSTTLDDQARKSINAAESPFTGRFMPEGSLDSLIGEEAQGTWYLEFSDDNVNDFGRLNGWSLELTTLGLSEVVVDLQASVGGDATDNTEAVFNATGTTTHRIVIPANQAEAILTLDTIDDDILDGTQNVEIAATAITATGLTLGSDTFGVTDAETLTMELSRTTVSEFETSPALIGTLQRHNTDINATYTVRVSTSDVTELLFPENLGVDYVDVTFGIGQTTATFSVASVDNNAFDGERIVTLTAIAPEYGPDLAVDVTVKDHEPTLTVSTLVNPIPENSGSMTISVRRTNLSDIGVPLTVNLVASPSVQTALIVPPVVSIPVGQDAVDVVVPVLDDTVLGARSVTITASAIGHYDGALQVDLSDYETLTVSIDRASIRENAGTGAAIGTVTRNNTDIAQSLTVTLTSNDVSEVSVPTTITIPAGQASGTFSINAINDPDLDGTQTVVVSASAPGYIAGQRSIQVLDHEPPVILTPVSGRTSDPRPVITWEALPNATRYKIQIASLSAGIDTLVLEDYLQQPQFELSEDLGVGRFRIWIQAFDQFEIPGFWSTPVDIFVETPPQLTGPQMVGTLALPEFPELSWTAVADAVSYNIWVNNLTTGENRVILEGGLTTTTFKPDTNMTSGTYRFWTQAVNAQGERGRWSTANTFTVLSTPSIVQPADGNSFNRNPLFEWTAVDGASHYDLYVSDADTGAVVLRNRNVSAASYLAASDFEFGTYKVWVQAHGDGFRSRWSMVRDFEIGRPLDILSPTQGSTQPGQVTFSWSSIAQAEHYVLWVNNAANQIMIKELNLTSTSYTSEVVLPAGQYRVWIWAVSTMGEKTTWAAPVSFEVTQSGEIRVLSEEQDSQLLADLQLLDRFNDDADNVVQAFVSDVATDWMPLVTESSSTDNQSLQSEATADEQALSEAWARIDLWTDLDLQPAAAADVVVQRQERRQS